MKIPKRLDLLASIYHNIGGIEHAAGHYAVGEREARKGIRIRERFSEADDNALAADLAALGALLEEQEKLDQAEQLYLRAKAIYEDRAAPNERELGYTYHALGSIAQRREDWPQASAYYRQSLVLKRKHLGEAHPSVAITLHELGLVQVHQEGPSCAERYLQSALEIMLKAFPPTHPHVIFCQNSLEHL